MKFECCGCKKSFSGTGLIVSSHGEEKVYCADCLWRLRKEYDTKKNCEDCGHFDEEKCGKTQAALAPVKVGFNTYYVEAETCKDYSTEKKTNPDKKKDKEPPMHKEAVALAKNLSDKGQTLTYYCCHCGAQLKIGARAPEIQQNCPRCKGDLEIINLSKFIKQHQ
jgi:NAD-dependent SIR2 family protein deacetylase